MNKIFLFFCEIHSAKFFYTFHFLFLLRSAAWSDRKYTKSPSDTARKPPNNRGIPKVVSRKSTQRSGL